MSLRFASDLMSLRDRFRGNQPAPRPDMEALEARAAQVLAARRGRASIAPAPKAGKAAAALLRPLAPKGSMGLSELKRRWADIVGASFANKTTPEKLSGGVLTLRAPSALAPFLQQQAPLIMDRLKLAGAAVKSVRIEQRAAAAKPASNLRKPKPMTPLEEEALAASFSHIDDPALRKALLRLGRAVKTR